MLIRFWTYFSVSVGLPTKGQKRTFCIWRVEVQTLLVESSSSHLVFGIVEKSKNDEPFSHYGFSRALVCKALILGLIKKLFFQQNSLLSLWKCAEKCTICPIAQEWCPILSSILTLWFMNYKITENSEKYLVSLYLLSFYCFYFCSC